VSRRGGYGGWVRAHSCCSLTAKALQSGPLIDVVRGVIRVRKWPRKRGPPKSAAQRFWIDWFKQANLLAKYADPMSQIRAKELTAHTGMYPRDILLAAMRGRLYTWVDENGWKWYPMAAVNDISESLDVLAQSVGSVLVRAPDRWRAAADAVINHVLTYKGPTVAPVWQAAGGGGGVTQEVLTGTPIVPDGTVNFYAFDVSLYVAVEIILEDVGFVASTKPLFEFSTDGGISYHAATGDYRASFVSHASSGSRLYPQIQTSHRDKATDQNGLARFGSLRAGRATWVMGFGTTPTLAFNDNGYAMFAGPVDHIRVISGSGSNFNAGILRAVGWR